MQINAMKKVLAAPQEEVRVNQIWHGIESRRYQYMTRGISARVVWAGGVGCVVALLIFVTWYSQSIGESKKPLMLQNRSHLPAVLIPRPDGAHVFSDGSQIMLKKDAKLEVLANTDKKVRFLLRRGAAAFDVVPNNDRTWKINCDGVEVVVVGTAFVVERTALNVVINVRRGAVLVKGDNVENGIQRLSAGKSLKVARPVQRPPRTPASNRGATSSKQRVLQQASTTPDTDADAIDSKQQSAVTWREHAKGGDYRKAYRTLGAKGVAKLSTQSQSAAELFMLADVARLGGRPGDAVLPLEKIIRSFPQNQKAGLAAYTLARLYLEQLGNPGEAAVLFKYAISLNLPAAMIETAMAKRVYAFSRIGDGRTQTAGEEYLHEYPNGKYSARVKNWMGNPNP